MLKNENEIMILLDKINFQHEDSAKEILEKIRDVVKHLIENNFAILTEILYRIDVDENKLKARLAQHSPNDAAQIIAQMIFERQKQKLVLRAKYTSANNKISDEEKW